MAQYLKILSLAVASCGSLLAQSATGDAARGEQVLRDRGCINCHKVNGEGGNRAPDLGVRKSRNYTPAGLAGVLWNHDPSAWAQTGVRTKGAFAINAGQSADLFAYFTSKRYFEPMADARRGKQIFRAKQCSSCHGIRERASADAPTVVTWHSLRDPIGFALDTWNPQGMERALERKGVRYPRFTSQEMNDLLLYLDNLREIRSKKFQFQLADSEQGRNVFHSVQCDSCHQGKASLEERTERISLADIQAEIWNASTRLKTLPAVSRDEMSNLFAYLWSLEPRGDAHHGEIAFTKKKCATCHTGQGSSAPMLSERDLSPVSMVAALLSHGSAMQAELTKRSLAWPQIHETEISDMAAYLRDRHPSAANEVPYRAAALDILSSRYR
jgi:cytochrome c2